MPTTAAATTRLAAGWMMAAAVIFCLLLSYCQATGAPTIFNIEDCGAKSDIESVEQALLNGKAIEKALQLASQSHGSAQVLIPAKVFWIMSIYQNNLKQVHLNIQGQLRAMKLENSHKDWPHDDGKKHNDIFLLENCEDLEISGSGMNGPVNIDGNGRGWWLMTILNLLEYKRPHMMTIHHCNGLKLHDIHVIDSPMYHFNYRDVMNVEIENVKIYVDLQEQVQLNLNNGHGHPLAFMKKMEGQGVHKKDWMTNFRQEKPSPLDFVALNTDGFDLGAKNVRVNNIDVTNFDDVVAVKPLSSNPAQYSNCSQDMVITNSKITYGVGLTIGSVPPSLTHACVRNIHFKGATFDTPYKAVYVKSNPGDAPKTGEITNILYEDLEIRDPYWFGIYIGPQQQDQPDGGGTGLNCMVYPFEECPTNPQVPMTDIVLRNVHTTGAYLPGVVRCNSTNPCHGFEFDGVVTEGPGEFWHDGYYCESIYGTHKNSHPVPQCFKPEP